MIIFLAHAGEDHAVEESTGFLSELLHQPTWAGLLTVLGIIIVIYLAATYLLRWSFASRLLAIVAAVIILGVLYLPHNPTVTGVILSAGFIVAFLLTFTLLGRHE